MRKPVFITGNEHKANHIQKLLGIPIERMAVDLDEIQSKSPEQVIGHKVRQAYAIAKCPVFVDDFSLWFDDLDGLPGPFIKHFVDSENGLENLCRMADGLRSRRVTARAYFGYFDGKDITIIHGEVKGEAPLHPKGEANYAFGSDPVFCVDGYDGRTRAELSREEYDKVYAEVRAIPEVSSFLRERISWSYE